MKFSVSVALPILFATYASAHGMLTNVKVAGKSFSVNDQASNIRKVSTQDPNKGASNPALNCGPNAQKASLVADAQPGDPMTFDWKTASGSNWVHNTGPMLTYMASCGSVPCSQFDSAQASWFKIDEQGRKPDGTWVQADLMAGGTTTVNVPKNLAPGGYMVRHEIIALHLATSLGGAEFYPGCMQINVGGSGTGAPSPNELVKLPGAYTDNDAGIFDTSVFDTNAPYKMPGPAISNLAANGAAAPAVPAAGSPAAGSPAPAASGASSPAAGAPTGSPAAGAPAPASTGSASHCGKPKNQKRMVISRQPTPVEDIADEVPEDAGDEIDLTQLRKAVAALGLKPRHFNSRIARRMAASSF
ncbi:glycosyl hydrolase family 61-domain-containing protein [Crepidotus variabilis]|uniref:AA9 family lytic polysaccharide monooxygenase n=1 Tax=Crepidotus variabilis TaxID=179855 RepID=A0A9P6JIV0_9AGAR|nr:glycosyl hydrolase family 61-domain-containing protein [Crepidotus variabilis]